jgi:spermidine/putrescine transport system ATP-binding protein
MSLDHAPAVDVRGAVKTFGSGEDVVRALDGVSVAIRQNEFFTLLGPSGCGKTTMLRLIAGFEQPTEGTILLDGEDITHLPPFRRPVNTVFQSYALFPHMTVAQNVAFGLEMQGIARAETTRRVEQMLALVKLSPLAGRRHLQGRPDLPLQAGERRLPHRRRPHRPARPAHPVRHGGRLRGRGDRHQRR